MKANNFAVLQLVRVLRYSKNKHPAPLPNFDLLASLANLRFLDARLFGETLAIGAKGFEWTINFLDRLEHLSQVILQGNFQRAPGGDFIRYISSLPSSRTRKVLLNGLVLDSMSSRNFLADVLFNSGDAGYVLGHVDFDAALTFTSMAATVVWTDTNCPWKSVSQEAFSVVDYTVHTGTTAVWHVLDDHYHGAPHAMARKMLLEFVEELIEKVGVPVTLGENQWGGEAHGSRD
jgi:hypothetical protein